MKNLILMTAIVSTAIASSQNANLEVAMSGFKNNDGKVHVGLYKSADSFLKKTFKGLISKIDRKTATVTFENLKPGEYAVSVYQDENSNGKMDSNFIGIPKEAYGTSNGAKGFMGPPKYKDAKFIIATDKKITIKLND